MIRSKSRTSIVTVSIIILLSCWSIDLAYSNDDETIRIASFNIQVFGQSKAGKPEVMDILAEIIRRYDIVAIQEIRNKPGTAIIALLNEVNKNGSSYQVITGPRVGRSTSKEQYAYMYDTETIEQVSDPYTFDDDNDGNNSNDVDDSVHPNDLYEREPYVAHFRVADGNFDFVLVNIHAKPAKAGEEIGFLPDVITDAVTNLNELDVICLRDFNADGRYYDESDYLQFFPDGQYTWLISNSVDTTVADSDNTYDRMVITRGLVEDHTGSTGVL